VAFLERRAPQQQQAQGGKKQAAKKRGRQESSSQEADLSDMDADTYDDGAHIQPDSPPSAKENKRPKRAGKVKTYFVIRRFLAFVHLY
jgi:hypothetical protein